MKKLFTILLCLLIALSFTACGNSGGGGTNPPAGDDPTLNKGEAVTAEQSQEILSLTEETLENISNYELSKFTYTTENVMTISSFGDVKNTMTVNYSLADSYFAINSCSRNFPIYDFTFDENTGEVTGYTLIGKGIEGIDADYFYIDNLGRLIDAHNSYATYSPSAQKEDESTSNYIVLSEDLATSQEIFNSNENELMEVNQFLSAYINYASSMINALSGFATMGNVSYGGISVEVKSRGAGHLYIKCEMPAQNIFYEAVIEDNFLVYLKTETSGSIYDIPEFDEIEGEEYNPYLNDVTKVVSIMRFSKDCSVSYPNLSTYQDVTPKN